MSLRLRIFGASMRLTVRNFFRYSTNPHSMRKHLERSARWFFRTPPESRFEDSQYPAGRAIWVSSGPIKCDAVVILYLHGGGYLAGSPDTHKKMVARLCRFLGMRAFLPSYRLAPEHHVPAGLEDAKLAWQHLVNLGYAPGQIILGGDSAGGGMALALLSWLCGKNLQPLGLFAWSPFTDQTFSGASVTQNAQLDHFFPADRVRDLSDVILGDTAPDDPQASPLFAKFSACPPVFIQTSECEILRDDALRMGAALKSQNAQVNVVLWPNTPHVWHIFDGWFPEARQAIKETANWIKAL